MPSLQESLNQILQFPLLVHQLVDRQLAIVNSTHGGKDDLLQLKGLEL